MLSKGKRLTPFANRNGTCSLSLNFWPGFTSKWSGSATINVYVYEIRTLYVRINMCLYCGQHVVHHENSGLRWLSASAYASANTKASASNCMARNNVQHSIWTPNRVNLQYKCMCVCVRVGGWWRTTITTAPKRTFYLHSPPLSLRYACHLVSVSVSVAVSVSISVCIYIYRSIFVCMCIKHLIVSDLLQGPRLD